MTTEMIDHTAQPPALETLIIVSTHLTEEDIPDPDHVHLTLGMDPDLSTDQNPCPAVNGWEVSVNTDGGLTLFSYGRLGGCYPAYPHILIDAKQAKELLDFLKKHEDVISQHGVK